MALEQPALQPFDFAQASLHTKQRGLWTQAYFRLIRNRLALVSAVLLAAIIAVALLGSFWDAVQNHDPAIQNYQELKENPSANHWLGTDDLGRDLWARLLDGTLFSLKIGLGAQLVVLLIGLAVGMTAALAGRLSDTVLMWITDLAFAFPSLIAIILFKQVLLGRDWPVIGSGDPQIPGFSSQLLVTILAISFVNWVTIARLVRGQMLSIREQDYVLAARAIGAGPWRLVRIHMLPNTLGSVIIAVTFGVPTLIFAEAALSFIGLGVTPPDASLGSLIANGRDHLHTHYLILIWPCLVIAMLMLCFTFLGDGLRDALDPRTKK
jgi:oligopeptide transport system permease protein